ncbi:MAG: glycosyltransferase family 1 protein [Romboutsia sp.]
MGYKKKKILHVVGGMNIGGTETMLMNLYRKIHNNIQFDFISYYDKDGYYDDEIRKLGGNVIRLEAPNKVGIVTAVKGLKVAIKTNGKYESVHTHTLFNCGIGVLAAYLSGVKVRISHAHTTSDNNDGIVKKIYISLMRSIIKVFSTDYLSCSDNAGKYLFGKNIVENKKYKKLPNYIDYESFINCDSKGSIREELVIEKDDIIVGHVGRFIKAKNHEFLIDVISELISKNPKVKGILVGTGHLEEEVKSKIKKLGLEDKVHILGIRDDINKIVNDMDLFILPSKYEGLGLVLLEAQAAGVPCLVSEAIQPEADLEVGLVERLNLADDLNIWSETALKMIDKPKVDRMDILNSFEKKGYKIENVVTELTNVYGLVRE